VYRYLFITARVPGTGARLKLAIPPVEERRVGVVRERMLIKMSTPQACIDARCLDVGSFCSYVQKSIDDCINLWT
jgi:hypothetical protein